MSFIYLVDFVALFANVLFKMKNIVLNLNLS